MAATLRPSDLLPQNLPPRSQPLQISSSLKPFFPHPPLSPPLSEPLASLSSSLSPADPHLPPQTLTSRLRPSPPHSDPHLLPQTTYFPLGPVFLLHILLPQTLSSFLHPQIQNQQHPLFRPSKPPLGRKQTPPPQSCLGPESLLHLQQGSRGMGGP